MTKPDSLAVSQSHGIQRRGISEAEALSIASFVIEEKTNALRKGTCIVPIGDRLLVKRIPEAELTRSGLHIPENSRDTTSVGVVMGAGQGRLNDHGQVIPMRVQVGAVVVFGRYAGTGVPVGAVTDEEQLIITEDEIFAVIASGLDADEIEERSEQTVVPARVSK